MASLMYSIQKYKAQQYILNTLYHKDVSIIYTNNGPVIASSESIHSNKPRTYNSHHHIQYALEYICILNSTSNITPLLDLTSHFVTNILNIYGITNTYSKLPHCTYIVDIDCGIMFGIVLFGLEYVFGINTFILKMPNDNSPMLLFLIDPLQAIKNLENKQKDPSTHNFFEYFKDTISKQDTNWLLKYFLITCLAERHIIVDIMYLVLNNIIHLLLL